MEDNDPAKEILDRMIERLDRGEKIVGLPAGLIVHVVEQSRCFGADAKTLEGGILIEENGEIRRANGRDLSMLSEIAPEFMRAWRLPEGE